MESITMNYLIPDAISILPVLTGDVGITRSLLQAGAFWLLPESDSKKHTLREVDLGSQSPEIFSLLQELLNIKN